jgi:hypothetical protein
VREAVREKLFRPRTPLSVITSAADSVFRRPILAGATALSIAAMVSGLLLIPGLREPEPPADEGPGKIELRGTVVDPDDPEELESYLEETGQLLKSLWEVNAQEVLASYDWMRWFGRTHTWRDKREIESHTGLFADLQKVYDVVAACDGQFGEEEIAGIQNIIAEFNLIERTREALQSQQ